MNINIGIYASREVSKDSILEFSDTIKSNFKDLNYGNGIDNITIGLICVSKNFEEFFKPRKAKYIKKTKEKEIDGIKYNVDNMLEFDCKIDFNSYQGIDNLERKKLIAKSILSTTIEVFEKIKIKNFDSDLFVKDLNSFLEKLSI